MGTPVEFHSMMLKSHNIIADILGNQVTPVQKEKDGTPKISFKELSPITVETTFKVNKGVKLIYSEKTYKYHDGEVSAHTIHTYLEQLGYFEPNPEPYFFATKEYSSGVLNPSSRSNVFKVFVKVCDQNGTEYVNAEFLLSFKLSVMQRLKDSDNDANYNRRDTAPVPSSRLVPKSKSEGKRLSFNEGSSSGSAPNLARSDHWNQIQRQPLPNRSSRILDSLIENDITERSATSPNVDKRSTGDVIKELGFWLYSTNVGQYFIKFSDEKARLGTVKTIYQLTPIWMMGICYSFPELEDDDGDLTEDELKKRTDKKGSKGQIQIKSIKSSEEPKKSGGEKTKKQKRQRSVSLPKKARTPIINIQRFPSPGDAFAIRRVRLFEFSLTNDIINQLKKDLSIKGFKIVWSNETNIEAEEEGKSPDLQIILLIKFYENSESEDSGTIFDVTAFANLKKANASAFLSSANEMSQKPVQRALVHVDHCIEFLENFAPKSEMIFSEGHNCDISINVVKTLEEGTGTLKTRSDSFQKDFAAREGTLYICDDKEGESGWRECHGQLDDGVFSISRIGGDQSQGEGFSIPIKMSVVRFFSSYQFDVHYNGVVYHFKTTKTPKNDKSYLSGSVSEDRIVEDRSSEEQRFTNLSAGAILSGGTKFDDSFSSWEEALNYQAGLVESDYDLHAKTKYFSERHHHSKVADSAENSGENDLVIVPRETTRDDESPGDPSHQEVLINFFQDFQSLYWISYRKDFPKIEPSNFTSDVGWGCMLRTAQMLLARAFTVSLLSRNWRLHLPHTEEELAIYRHILLWFADNNEQESYYSLHNMAKTGRKLDKRIGEWFGPCTAAYVLRRLSVFHKGCPLTFFVNQDQVIYSDLLIEQATDEGNWKHVLVLLPVRLGVDHLNPVYFDPLKKLFTLPQFLGIAGGRPCKSLYFAAAQDDEFFYLDPHIVKPHIDIRKEKLFPIESYHCDTVRTAKIGELDPSMLIGFLMKSLDDYLDFVKRYNELTQPKPGENEATEKVFSIHETAPKYVRDSYKDELASLGFQSIRKPS